MSEAAKEYARALDELAVEEHLEERLLAETRAVRAVFMQNPAYARLLSNPEIPKAERTALLENAFGDRIHVYLLHFLKLITERGYAYRTEDFLREFDRLYCERHGIVTASVQSAVPLTEEQQTRLREKLEALTGKTIELCCTVEPSLIGGVRLHVNNTLFEGSVRARLDSLRASLRALTL